VVFDDVDAESMWHNGGLSWKAAAAKQTVAGKSAGAAASGLTAAVAEDGTAASVNSNPEPIVVQQMQLATPADAATAGSTQPPGAGMPAIPGLEDTGDDLLLGNVVGMPAEGRAGAATPDLTVAGEKAIGAVAFPGVNAPIPEGADPTRWGTEQNGAPNGLHGSQAASSRGVKRSFESTSDPTGGAAAALMTYGAFGHGSVGEMQRPRHHYHVRNPEPAHPPQSAPLPSPAPPSLFASKLVPMPDVQRQPQPYSGFAMGSVAPQVQQPGYAAGHLGPPLPPPDAAYQQMHRQQAAYAQQMHQQQHSFAQHSYVQHSYPQPSYAQPSYPAQPSNPGPRTPGLMAWQQPAQWQAPQTVPMYRTRQ